MAGFVKTKGRSDGGDTIKAATDKAIEIPAGTTAERPTESKAGDLRFNTSTNKMEYFDPQPIIWVSKNSLFSMFKILKNVLKSGYLFA